MSRPGSAGEPDEFSLVRQYFAPLTQEEEGAFNLLDDAALLRPRQGYEYVITKDAMVEGVHFLDSDPLDQVARKLLRVNLSDLAAKGATPWRYLLAVHWPQNRPVRELALLAEGLAKDQEIFGLCLVGGDSVSTPGPASFSITALGEVPAGKMAERRGARPGDSLYVTGTLGDGATGLGVARGQWPSLSRSHARFLLERYQLPRPRVAWGIRAGPLISAAVDISDGLLADLGHLCHRSGVSAHLYKERLPLSEAVAALLETESPEPVWDAILGGGDDYEILATVSPENREALEALGRAEGLRLTPVGEIVAGRTGVSLLDSRGIALSLPQGGYRHF